MKTAGIAGLFLFLVSAVCTAGTFEYATPAVAGPPGGQASPVLVIGFRGDGQTTDAQIDLLFDPARFSVQLTPRSNAFCQEISGSRIRILSPGSIVALPTAFVRYCEIRISILAGTASGSYNFAPSSEPDTLVCSNALGEEVPCFAPSGVGVVRVGATTPQAQFTYFPPAGSTVGLNNDNGTSAEISADFTPGGFGASIELSGCAIAASGGSLFGPVLAAPTPFSFVSDQVGTGLIALTCTRQLAQGSGVLTCNESRNGGAPVVRSWNLTCPALPPDFVMASDFEDPV